MAVILACAALRGASAQNSAFLRGEELFRQNKPEEAVPLLREAVTAGDSPQAYVYLALAYFQQRLYSDALEVCNAGMLASGTNKKVLAYNGGNVAFAIEDYEAAEKWYTMAITVDTTYSPAVLNRAQSRLKLGRLAESRDDYRKYLILEPQDAQRPQIEQLLALLDDEIAASGYAPGGSVYGGGAGGGGSGGYGPGGTGGGYGPGGGTASGGGGSVYIQAENASIAAENAQIEAENAERLRKLLEDVAASLQGAESQNMSAGAEGTVDYGYESELE